MIERIKAHPLASAVIVGALLRFVAAFSGYGWFAPDDYEFGVQQAGIWLSDPSQPFGCDFRSPLMSRLFWGLMWLAARAGVTDRAALLHWAYAGLGALSVLGIVAVYCIATPLGRRTQAAAAWLMAAYALMPRISTRAMIEVIAIVPMLLGVLFLQRARAGRKPWSAGVLAGMGLGMAALLRFQMGVLFAAATGLLLWDIWGRTAWRTLRRRSVAAPRTESSSCGVSTASDSRSSNAGGQRIKALATSTHGLGALAGLWCGGAAMALLQGALDVSMQRPFLATPWRYIQFNLQNANTYGTSPWYTYALHFLAFTLPPLTLFLWRPMLQAMRAHSTVAVLWITFVATHSLIGHKEDRFMFPMLPLFFIPLGAALVQLHDGSRWQRRAYHAFVAANIVALILTTFSDAHRNFAAPLLEASRLPGARLAAVGFGRVPTYYAGDAAVRTFGSLDEVEQAVRESARFERILLRHPPSASDQARLQALPGLQCSAPQLYPGDWMDQVLVRVNRHNGGRTPTALVRCSVL